MLYIGGVLNILRSDDKQALAFLDKSVLREVGVYTSNVVACSADIMEQYKEVGFVLLMRRKAKGLF
jgi:hypothetical protein